MVIMMNKATHGTRESYSDAAIANEKLTKWEEKNGTLAV